ncbi:MAG TPA: phosphoadenylyl-sulfate reductase [Bryobacteraceae bacterium]
MTSEIQPTTELEGYSAADLLAWALEHYGDSFAIASSFQKEDMVIVDLAARAAGKSKFRVFTLDTGRLHEETYEMMEEVRRRYGVVVETVFPHQEEVERMVAEHGPNLFLLSPELRHACCDTRKTRPLGRKLSGLRAWATGLRREQSATRAHVPKVETVEGILKLSPLADWTAAQVEDYTREHNLPVHPLYACGYASIGCAPCTRAIQPGEPERAGRWWWEQGNKECGIHFNTDGSVRRNVTVQPAPPHPENMHKGFTLWFTGLSGAGKSTLSEAIAARLRGHGAEVELLDGDMIRTRLSKGLGFSKEDRDENIRRIGFVCELLSSHGIISIVAAISPYRAIREEVRSRIANFVEVYVECPIEVLARRDIKGLYKRALAGEIRNFTGISDPYEPPLAPAITVNSSQESPEQSIERIWATLENSGLISFDRSTLAH